MELLITGAPGSVLQRRVPETMTNPDQDNPTPLQGTRHPENPASEHAALSKRDGQNLPTPPQQGTPPAVSPSEQQQVPVGSSAQGQPHYAAPVINIVNQQGGGGGGGFNPAFLEGDDKSPGLALFLSFIWVGAGQLYNGQIGKGILMFFGAVALWFALLGWIIHIWSWIDAYSVAKKKRQQYRMMLMGGGQGGGGQVARMG